LQCAFSWEVLRRNQKVLRTKIENFYDPVNANHCTYYFYTTYNIRSYDTVIALSLFIYVYYYNHSGARYNFISDAARIHLPTATSGSHGRELRRFFDINVTRNVGTYLASNVVQTILVIVVLYTAVVSFRHHNQIAVAIT